MPPTTHAHVARRLNVLVPCFTNVNTSLTPSIRLDAVYLRVPYLFQYIIETLSSQRSTRECPVSGTAVAVLYQTDLRRCAAFLSSTIRTGRTAKTVLTLPDYGSAVPSIFDAQRRICSKLSVFGAGSLSEGGGTTTISRASSRVRSRAGMTCRRVASARIAASSIPAPGLCLTTGALGDQFGD